MTSDDLAPILSDLAGATGLPFDASSFDSRLRIQKAVYLLKRLGSTRAARYNFSDYFHGPYSPGLAKDYYGLKESGKLRGAGLRAPKPAKVTPRIAAVAEAVERGNDFLEAVTALHSVVRRNPTATQTELRVKFKSLKPHLESGFDDAWAYLTKHRLATGPTSTPTS